MFSIVMRASGIRFFQGSCFVSTLGLELPTYLFREDLDLSTVSAVTEFLYYYVPVSVTVSWEGANYMNKSVFATAVLLLWFSCAPP